MEKRKALWASVIFCILLADINENPGKPSKKVSKMGKIIEEREKIAASNMLLIVEMSCQRFLLEQHILNFSSCTCHGDFSKREK